MNYKKSTTVMLLTFGILLTVHTEVLAWRANIDQQYQTQVTVKESVTSLESITTKPPVVTDASINQEAAAKNESTIPYLHALPSFPIENIVPGSKWTAKATITYDLSSFGYTIPIVVEVPVSYTFIEMTEIESRSYFHISAKWFPVFIPDRSLSKRSGIVRLSGSSQMDLFWDNKAGSPKRSILTEEIQYLFHENASLLLTRETTEVFKTATDIQRAKDISDLNKQIATQKVANVEVKQSNEGIVLSIDNIQFEAESAKLVEAEKVKLTKIGGLLATLKNRKLKVIGHAANPAGSNEEELLALSTTRAQAVADYLVETGIRTADSVIATGMGGSKPIASNETAEGRTKNRRVEILIIDEETQK